ncbi:Tetratricopeptide TPR_2 repeat-containing protein [Candidatus Omnitrophus magneticus]|uniref:Tetratricopeptide TPR_2 repeat-containing protein n=1 Tax=Candidatus Omnitrophus magneticus TaxID=1609969 RepID=A0A0F0CR46_9BACT|nr:Tetratricopeptide TPR_2 repeat-containing protein [Candidatus Omnitrophus magneticus]
MIKKFFITQIILVSVFMFFSSHLACSMSVEKTEELFISGNSFYEKGEYNKAINEYEKILDMGSKSGILYYNLANAYYRSGNTGKAIINYIRAKRLSPRDSDILANYRHVSSTFSGMKLRTEGIWKWKNLKNYYEDFTIDELLIIFSASQTTAFIFIFLAIRFRYFFWKFFIIALVCLFFAAGNSAIAFDKIKNMTREAVIIPREAAIHYGPSDSTTVFFKMREGMETVIIGDKDAWFKIQRPDGKTGWIQKSNLEIV